MDNPLINQILNQVKQNKKYKTISDKIILNEIKNYLSKNKLSRISKQDIKNIRNYLHKSYSVFQTKKKNKINIYFEELKQNPDSLEIINKLLSITLSTKERLEFYPELYKQIFNITGKPKTIIDLGCGFNPFSFPMMNLMQLNYYCYDIDEKDIEILNQYFKIMKQRGLNGKASIINLRDITNISSLPSSDIIFLFKIIDLLDKENHKQSEELIKNLISKTKYIAASFATKTITRRKMNYPNRKWFELMLQRNNLKFNIIKTSNEIFYLISI